MVLVLPAQGQDLRAFGCVQMAEEGPGAALPSLEAHSMEFHTNEAFFRCTRGGEGPIGAWTWTASCGLLSGGSGMSQVTSSAFLLCVYSIPPRFLHNLGLA